MPADLRLVPARSVVSDPPAGPVATAVGFAEAVRLVGAVARKGRLVVPVFRSPPRHSGADRAIRRRGPSPAVVAIRLSGRPLAAVRGDVIEGVVVSNALEGERADRFRRAAWAALEPAAAPQRPQRRRNGRAVAGEVAAPPARSA